MVIIERPLRGSRLSSFYPPIPAEGPSLTELDSAFQLQEYIALLIRRNPHDVDTIVSYPGPVKSPSKADDPSDKDSKEVVVDENCWIYEQLRRLAQDLTHPLITTLQLECNRSTCPEMKAGEWLYLCVAHGNEGAMEQCCAIDYIIHTLDSATALLNSPRAFPSRLSIPQSSIRHFSSLARRLGRIFAHAYFHHRDAFETAEAESGLYARFLALTDRFDLVPAEFLVIPPRVVNHENAPDTEGEVEPPRLRGADPHPPPLNQSQENQSIYESPRKVGRNRTDTMVFSDAEAFSEALRSSSSGLSAEKSALGIENMEDEKDDEGNDQSTSDSLGQPDTSDGDSEAKPYQLSFSASGTMKTALPPGVSPSTSSIMLSSSGNANENSGHLQNQGDVSRSDEEIRKEEESSSVDNYFNQLVRREMLGHSRSIPGANNALSSGVSSSESSIMLTSSSGNVNDGSSEVPQDRGNNSQTEEEARREEERRAASNYFDLIRRTIDGQRSLDSNELEEEDVWQPQTIKRFHRTGNMISIGDIDDDPARHLRGSNEYIVIGEADENTDDSGSEPAESDSPVIVQSEGPEGASDETGQEEEEEEEEEEEDGEEEEVERIDSSSAEDSGPSIEAESKRDENTDDTKDDSHDDDKTKGEPTSEERDGITEEPVDDKNSADAPQNSTLPEENETKGSEEKAKEEKSTSEEADDDSVDLVDPNVSLETDLDDVEKVLEV